MVSGLFPVVSERVASGMPSFDFAWGIGLHPALSRAAMFQGTSFQICPENSALERGYVVDTVVDICRPIAFALLVLQLELGHALHGPPWPQLQLLVFQPSLDG